ncbi:gamma-glutamyl-gamma-aminobutyrate hydrolase family protein [Alkalibacterium putridalgicola]|uniref:gamma-glutamyl-gamma-aminobutyrate hydrolase family protein n=1 Tax=Alkalibacterium putridalgicola TaxID=426703 RepID=UPI0034CE383D
MKPVIGIPGNILTNFSPRYTSLPITYRPHGFIEGLQTAGALPVVFPISKEEDAKHYVESVDAVLLAGGQDVSPLTYGEEPHIKLQDTSLIRDQFEIAVIKEAWTQNKPVLAICRGLQIFNVAFGGTLYQDVSLIPDLNLQHVQESTPETAAHSITIENDSWLGQLYGAKALVNSYHHQAIKQLATNLRPVAWSNDGLIEAFESKDDQHITLGVQWHPELMIHNSEAAQGLFNAYVKTVRDWKNNQD